MKNKVGFGFKVNEMDNNVYQLRRKVIDIIYEVKKIYDIPRIDVRIVSDGQKNICGYAYLKSNVIHINEEFINIETNKLKWIVLHELIHAITGFKHDENCCLMCPYLPKVVNYKMIFEKFGYYLKNFEK